MGSCHVCIVRGQSTHSSQKVFLHRNLLGLRVGVWGLLNQRDPKPLAPQILWSLLYLESQPLYDPAWRTESQALQLFWRISLGNRSSSVRNVFLFILKFVRPGSEGCCSCHLEGQNNSRGRRKWGNLPHEWALAFCHPSPRSFRIAVLRSACSMLWGVFWT